MHRIPICFPIIFHPKFNPYNPSGACIRFKTLSIHFETALSPYPIYYNHYQNHHSHFKTPQVCMTYTRLPFPPQEKKTCTPVTMVRMCDCFIERPGAPCVILILFCGTTKMAAVSVGPHSTLVQGPISFYPLR